ncbi:hypothetical protein BHE74_00037553 [Ensete ventricosum]|nr:hypothetical protein BHE74_00037553 [Ensete ventricosum]
MGLLDQLWDDTVAGPPPVGKLRKYNSFSPSSSAAASAAGGVLQVTRSITILRTASSSAATSPRSPSSPASAPDSPLARKTSFSPLFELLLWQRRGRGETGSGCGGNRCRWLRERRRPSREAPPSMTGSSQILVPGNPNSYLFDDKKALLLEISFIFRATGTQKTVFLRLCNCNYRKKHGLQGGDKFSRQMKVRWGEKGC